MKSIFITGAAHGIGLATARRFASRGWFVGLYDVNREVLDALLDSEAFPAACGQYCDVTDAASVEAALRHFADRSGGRLDVLVNNAGVLSSGRFEEIDSSANDRMVDVNVRGLTTVAHAAFPLLRDTPGAVLLNLCSASSIHGIPLLAVYSATKFYVNGLTEALSIEWAPHDIRVTAVKPPVVNTAMGKSLHPKLTARMGVDMQPEDVAAAIELAVDGKRIGYVLGTSTRLWYGLNRLLPEWARIRLIRYLTGH
jgi:NAD(P)-dependent dehydrogenase (short-subunit alcohol dehydrogenase family)